MGTRLKKLNRESNKGWLSFLDSLKDVDALDVLSGMDAEDINTRDENGHTFVTATAFKGKAELLQVAVSKGGNVQERQLDVDYDMNGDGIVGLAIESGDSDTLKSAIDLQGIPHPNLDSEQCYDLDQMLSTSAVQGKPEMMEVLKASGYPEELGPLIESVPELPNIRPRYSLGIEGDGLCHQAFLSGNPDAIRMAYKLGGDPTRLDSRAQMLNEMSLVGKAEARFSEGRCPEECVKACKEITAEHLLRNPPESLGSRRSPEAASDWGRDLAELQQEGAAFIERRSGEGKLAGQSQEEFKSEVRGYLNDLNGSLEVAEGITEKPRIKNKELISGIEK